MAKVSSSAAIEERFKLELVGIKAVEEILILNKVGATEKTFLVSVGDDPDNVVLCTTDDGTSVLIDILSVRLTCKAQGDRIYIEQKEEDLGLRFCEFVFYNMPQLKLWTDITAVYTSTAGNRAFISATTTI